MCTVPVLGGFLETFFFLSSVGQLALEDVEVLLLGIEGSESLRKIFIYSRSLKYPTKIGKRKR